MSFEIGIDSYSYHRLLGGLRPGEAWSGPHLANGSTAVVAEARRGGAEYVSLETMFLGAGSEFRPTDIRRAAGATVRIGLSWGGAEGFALGSAPRAVEDLSQWFEVARSLGTQLVRIVVGGPRHLGKLDRTRFSRTAEQVAVAADVAEGSEIQLAIENHGDMRAGELVDLVACIERENVGICFDTVNALRVGDDPVEALWTCLPALRMVHLKDCSADESDRMVGPLSVPYGTGIVPVNELVDRLLAVSFTGPVCIELGQLAHDVDERELVNDCVSWLRSKREKWTGESIRRASA